MKKFNFLEHVGVRHVQAVLLFWGYLLFSSMDTMMSMAIVAMTDVKSSNPDFPEFDWDTKKQSWIQSASLWGCVISQVPMGFLIRSPGAYKFLLYTVFGCCVLTALTPLLAIYVGWIAVFCCRLAVGMAQGCLTPCTIILVTKWSPVFERSQFASFVLNSKQIGSVMTSAITGMLAASRLGWPSIFYMYGIVGTIWAIFFYWFGADSPSTHSRISAEEKEYIESGNDRTDDGDVKQNWKFPWKAVFTSLSVWSLVFTAICHTWSYYMLMTQMPMYMKSILEFDIEKSGTTASLPYLAKWLMGFPLSWLSDFSIRKGISKAVVRKTINTVGMWGPAAAMLTLCLLKSNDETTLVVILVLAVGLNAGVICSQSINEIDLTPNFSSKLASINDAISMVFGAMAPVVCALIVTDTKNVDQWYIIFWISAALYFFGNLSFLFFGRVDVQPWNELPHKTLSCDDNNVSPLSTHSKISDGHKRQN